MNTVPFNIVAVFLTLAVMILMTVQLKKIFPLSRIFSGKLKSNESLVANK